MSDHRHPVVIPVTVVTGFLGAGKSTLVERWLAELPRAETAVIINERGEVGIDGELLAAHVARVREITGGCVCCEGQAELARALEELSQTTPRPTRILVETSGVASPAGVVRAVSQGSARERLRLDGVVTVLDVTRAREALRFDLAVEQLGFADVVVLSHVDLLDAATDIGPVESVVAEHAPAAVVTRFGRGLPASSFHELLAERTETLHVPREAGSHPAIDAISLVLDGELDEERFGEWVERALGDVEARILRIKGILAMEGVEARVIVQGVGESVEVLVGRPWGDALRNCRLVVLGLGLDEAALEAGFLACRVGR
ncbi:MAG: GTP-binding protein [Myxococcales bacterium]|nr:GTP-binding protein [Myxococcales bacterium]